MKILSPAEALNKAATYCTTCERCISEVSAKLDAWKVAPAEQKKIIDRLQQEGFIDEERYCKAFVNDKLKFNRWGRIKITTALRNKCLPRDLISQSIENIDEETYTRTLRELIAVKQKELRGDDYATMQKLIRFAASRGFEPAVILKTIKYNGDEMDF